MEQDNLKKNISIVVICKNEELYIEKCLKSCSTISDDLIVVDSGSTDNTIELAQKCGATVYSKDWSGYGNAKNFGAHKAKHDWVLSLDADELVDIRMANQILTLKLSDKKVYGFKRLNHIDKRPIKFGEWNPDIKFRLYNKKVISWSLDKVHEYLIIPKAFDQEIIDGTIFHYSYDNLNDLQQKLSHYAELSAQDLILSKKSISYIKAYIKATFRFLKSYVLKLGFLDGKIGFQIALAYSKYVIKRFKYYKKILKS